MAATFEAFCDQLNELSARFEKGLSSFLTPDYSEARLRADFLDPFFRALGWDLENAQGLVQTQREVEIESRTDMAGRAKRADYLFRTDRTDRFICEAKKPAEELRRHAFQAKRYAWNKGVYLAILSDFEELHVFIVGSRPRVEEQDLGLWKSWTFREYPQSAREIWDLLSREAVASGSIDKLIDTLPKSAKGKGKAKARQQWLIKPDRTRAIDAEFLNFLDEARRELAGDLLQQNDRDDLLADNRLNEAVQRILDRLLFLRICEDRDIDTGRPLATILRNWRERSANPAPRKLREKGLWAHDEGGGFAATDPRPAAWPLWNDVVAHLQALDRRPASHIPFFNGNLFKPHFSETLKIGDAWLAGFLDDLSDEESPYLFNVIPVEILGTIYERFLGKSVRPQGRGVTIEEKPEVRKAGGVYYTPRYIVDYIVEQTVGKLLADRTPEKSLDLRILDPACGSGSFLIRAFERLCEHWQADFKQHPSKRKRSLCWVDEATGDVHLSTDLKRRILIANIYGVDLDAAAVEVTQLSLYLKMLEGENRQTLAAERDLFGNETPLLPPLQDNIKHGNSLIASDFSVVPEDLTRVHAFDWDIQFASIMKNGGFDAVIGNPPYIRIQQLRESDPDTVIHFKAVYRAGKKGNCDIYVLFVERSLSLINPRGCMGFIVPNKFLNAEYGEPLRGLLSASRAVQEIVHFGSQQVFEGATTYTCLLFLSRHPCDTFAFRSVANLDHWATSRKTVTGDISAEKLSSMPWNICVGEGSDLIERLGSMPTKLGDEADIFVGLQTSADDVYILDFVSESPRQLVLRSAAAQRDIAIEKELAHPVVSGTDVGGYRTLPKRQFIVFPYSVEAEVATLIPWPRLRAEFPKTADYLESFRNRLMAREGGKFRDTGWYRFGRNQNLGIQGRAKVCVPRLVDRLCAAIDPTGSHCLDNVDVGGVTWRLRENQHDLRYLLALLNSRLLAWYFPSISAPFRGGWMSANRQFLSLLPFRSIDFTDPTQRARHDKLVELVDKMLSLVPKLRAETSEAKKKTLQNAVDATDRQIDRLVYELYGLTEEEIALVEAGGAEVTSDQ